MESTYSSNVLIFNGLVLGGDRAAIFALASTFDFALTGWLPVVPDFRFKLADITSLIAMFTITSGFIRRGLAIGLLGLCVGVFFFGVVVGDSEGRLGDFCFRFLGECRCAGLKYFGKLSLNPGNFAAGLGGSISSNLIGESLERRSMLDGLLIGSISSRFFSALSALGGEERSMRSKLVFLGGLGILGGSGDLSMAAISGLTDLIDVSIMGVVGRGGFDSKIEDIERGGFISKFEVAGRGGLFCKIDSIEGYWFGSKFGVIARGGFALDPAGFRYFALTDSI